MTFVPQFDVNGVAATIKELGRIDPELAKAARARLKETAAPLVAAARQLVPAPSPLSRWKAGGRIGWEAGRARSAITAKPSTAAPRGRRIKLLSVVQANPAGAVFDMAGRASGGRTPQGQAFIRNLNARYGTASRAMWRAAEQTRPQVEQALQTAVRDVEDTLSRRLGGD